MPHCALAKINKRAHMEALLQHGTVFMQRLGAFPDVANRVVGDPNEGLRLYYAGSNPSLRVNVTVEKDSFAMPREMMHSFRVMSSARDHAVFCMTGFPIPAERNSIDITAFCSDPRVPDFGDTMVLVQNNTEFVRRFHAAAKQAGHDVALGKVEYMPQDHCGDMNAFRKLESYSWQLEWRFLTRAPIVGKSITLTLGPLQDIVTLIDLRPVFAAAAK
jgi:hypothetical protein